MVSWFRRLPDGSLLVCVHAQPGARRTEVAGLHGDAIKIRVAAPALEDRANEALAEFIADRVGIARREVRLVSGAKSRAKKFSLPGAADATRLLAP